MPEELAKLRGKRIWLVDRREHWRERFARDLRASGADVTTLGRYASRTIDGSGIRESDLVVLLCTAVTPAELTFVQEVRGQGTGILVLVVSLSPQAMRDLFLAGALDVTEMPVSSRELVELVAEASATAAAAREHRASALAGL